MTKEHSLFHKVFRSKYFRTSSFLNAKASLNPSWAWRSLLEGRKVIDKGSKWRIGNGECMTITDDPWMSNNYLFRIQQEACHNPHLQLVKQLMDKANKWNVNLTKHSFDEQVVEEILQTKIMQGQDALVWKFERNGLYSIASGYSIAFNCFYPPSSEYPVHFSNKELWRSVWSLRTPPKLNVLVWKLMHNGVPVRQCLRERFLTVDDRCPRCLNESESVYHCFLSCPHSMEV